MARGKSMADTTLLAAALEGLELQRARIDEQIRKVKALLGHGRAKPATAPAAAADEKPVRRKLSKAARRRISAAQKQRWAQYRKTTSGKE
jgi:hypothetical protein